MNEQQNFSLKQTQHYPNCSSDYPEKLEAEPAQALQEINSEDSTILVCVDCGKIQEIKS